MQNETGTNSSENEMAELKLEAMLNDVLVDAGLRGEIWSDSAIIMGKTMRGCLDIAQALCLEQFGASPNSIKAEMVDLAIAIFDKLIVGVSARPDPSSLMIPGGGGTVLKLDPSGGVS